MARDLQGVDAGQGGTPAWPGVAGGMLAALAIGLSAYAAHGIDDAHARSNLQTACLYAFGHGVALATLGPWAAGRLARVALAVLLLGVLLFCGSLAGGALAGMAMVGEYVWATLAGPANDRPMAEPVMFAVSFLSIAMLSYLLGRQNRESHALAEPRGGEAEPLAHAEGVAADATVGGVGELDEREHVVDARTVEARRRRDDPQVVAPGAAGVRAVGPEQRADLAAGLGERGVGPAADERAAGGGRDEPEDRAHGRGLARAVRAEEGGDAARPDLERDVVDGRDRAEALGQALEGDVGHGGPPSSERLFI